MKNSATESMQIDAEACAIAVGSSKALPISHGRIQWGGTPTTSVGKGANIKGMKNVGLKAGASIGLGGEGRMSHRNLGSWLLSWQYMSSYLKVIKETKYLLIYILLLAQIVGTVALVPRLVDFSTNYYIQLGALLILTQLIALRRYPLDSQRRIISRAAFWAVIAIAVLGLNIQMKNGNILFWFPSNHQGWEMIPFFGICWIGWFLLGLEI